MTPLIDTLRQTAKDKRVAILRIVGGLPLLLFGLMHLLDPEPFRQVLKVSGIPLVELNLWVAPLAEVAAGLLLITGYYARLGGVGGIATMLAAVWATIVLGRIEQSPEVPPVALPLVVLAISTYVLWKGAGAWSLDARHAADPAAARRLASSES